jgi:hypothetical protein
MVLRTLAKDTFVSIGDDRVVIRQDIPEKHKFSSTQLKKDDRQYASLKWVLKGA